MEDKILRVSKSTINDYDWCPYQYKMKHIYRLAEAENEDMIRGTNVHSIVEYFWVNVTPVIPTALSLLEEGKSLLAKDTLWEVIPSPPAPDKYQYGEEVVIRKWFDWQWERFVVTKGENWTPVGNEVSSHATTTIEVDGHEIPIHMRGFIDTVFSDGSGGFILMELKTGKWREKKTATKMRVEMQIYRMMLEEGGYTDFLPVTHWAWEFPRGYANYGDRAEWEMEEVGTRKTQFAPRTAMKKIKALIRGHLYDLFEPAPFQWPHPSGDGSTLSNCSYCSFMELCPAWATNEGEENNENEEE